MEPIPEYRSTSIAFQSALMKIYPHLLVICPSSQIRRPNTLRFFYPWSAPGHRRGFHLPVGNERTSLFMECERWPLASQFVPTYCSRSALKVHIVLFHGQRRPRWLRMCFRQLFHPEEERENRRIMILHSTNWFIPPSRCRPLRLHMAWWSYAWLLACQKSQGSEIKATHSKVAC